jgi:hypothetical protein
MTAFLIWVALAQEFVEEDDAGGHGSYDRAVGAEILQIAIRLQKPSSEGYNLRLFWRFRLPYPT